MNSSTPLSQIKGVGVKTAKQFSLAEIELVGDLINFLPYRHEDYSQITKISQISPGKVTIKAKCISATTRQVRRGMSVTVAVLEDQTGRTQAVWFNQPYRAKQFAPGKEYYFSGNYEFSRMKYQLMNPSAELAFSENIQTSRFLPIYKAIKGLKSQLVRKIIFELQPYIKDLPETLPQQILDKFSLVPRAQALLGMHFPSSSKEVDQARDRLAFEEVFNLILAGRLNKLENTKLESWKIKPDIELAKQFIAGLNFKLTDAQRRVAWEIMQDFDSAQPMNRLLQGDVGAGKTVVAGLAALQVARRDMQSAVMAPTEVLAVQHAKTLEIMFKDFGLRVGLLTSGVRGAHRDLLYKAIKNGEVDIVVGTHALIQGTVKFHKLAFVVIDEQHRFGVDQRQELLKKSVKMPHMLSMTATPIPRSLALTLYGELDISVLDQKPSQRKPIITKIWSPNSKAALYELIDEQLNMGHQAYIICSLIDGDLGQEAKSVKKEYDKLKASVFRHRKIAMLHGKMKASEKNQIMKDFAAGEFDILVSTTVVEVGVDVPNASVIVIEDADKFGLAQLHQLRGRVGRSSQQSYCYLVTSTSAKPTRRLREIEKSNDGFYLAEVDMEIRGPGEIYGRSQHGELNLQIASLADVKLLAQARQAADWFVKSGANLLEYPELAKQVRYYQRLTTLN